MLDKVIHTDKLCVENLSTHKTVIILKDTTAKYMYRSNEDIVTNNQHITC